jgi:hypothetical protein
MDDLVFVVRHQLGPVLALELWVIESLLNLLIDLGE